MWKVKIDWKNECHFGSTVIFGDSTALEGFKTPDLGADYTNFALGGATMIEAYYMLQHLLACPNPPKRVILSYQPYHFIENDWLWRRTFSWGVVSLDEAYDIHKNAMQLKDYAYFSMGFWGRISDDIAIWFHMARFPTLRFGSLLYSLPFGRLEENTRVYKNVARDFGYHTMGDRADLHEPNNLAILDKFIPGLLNTFYLEKILETACRNNIVIDYYGAAFNETSARVIKPEVKAAYLAYMQKYKKYFTIFVPLPAVPDRFMTDPNHTNVVGAATLTADVKNLIAQSPKSNFTGGCSLTANLSD